VKDTNGASDERRLLETPVPETPSDWSRDGRLLLVLQGNPPAQDVGVAGGRYGKGRRSLSVDLVQRSRCAVLTRRPLDAYTSNESGRSEIYLRSFTLSSGGQARVGGKWQASNRGGVSADWRGDGKELFYRELTGAVMSVDVATDGETIRTGQPKQLFPLAANVAQWDASADGQRFLVGVPAAAPTSDPISVILNWTVLAR
jgi:hypothetical protein